MDRREAIARLVANRGAFVFKETNEALDLAIEALSAETHEIRTETHECVSETHGDLISRDDAREAIEKLMEIHFDRQVVLAKARDAIVSLPPADTDMSDYSDRLWKAAYERGKADGCASEDDVDYCTNCPHISWNGDLISRQAAVESMANAIWHYPNDLYKNLNSYEMAKGLAEDGLMILPSAEAVQMWIPVSERVPKEKKEVYVTVYFTEGDTGRAYGYIDGFGNWHLYSTVEGTLNSGYEVTAWMPLPEPYKGGDTE